MASFFKKALSVFVEFDDTQTEETTITTSTPTTSPNITVNQAEAEKFEAYFEKLFEKANFPGPDYFEFYKMMEALETAIPDEKTRYSATFASLSIQGLTKQAIIDTANKYRTIIETDKIEFDRALNDKMKVEVEQRQNELKDLEKKITSNSELIQKLTKEISESQVLIEKLKSEVKEEQNKLTKNSLGYQVASQAVTNKINLDIQKIQSIL